MIETGKTRSGRVYLAISKDIKEGITAAIKDHNGSIGTRQLVEELTNSRNISRDEARSIVVVALETGHIRCGKRLRLEPGRVFNIRPKVA